MKKLSKKSKYGKLCSMRIIAHNIRSMHNVGAIFRSAAAFGIEHIALTGYTPTPPRKEIAKVALGSERLVAWESKSITEAISDAKHAGYTVIALEQTQAAQPLHTFQTHIPVALILGNEITGIEPDVLALADAHAHIPMHAKRSLNVSVAAGIAMHYFTTPSL